MSNEVFEEKAIGLKQILETFGEVQADQDPSDQDNIVPPSHTYTVRVDNGIEIEFCIRCKDNDAEPPYEIIATLKSGELKYVNNNQTLERLNQEVRSLELNDRPFYEYRS